MNTRFSKPRARSQERGQVLPLVAITLVALMGFAALAVDVGYWRYQQQIEQSAADSGAIAGASALAFPPASYSSAAKTDVTTNGFTDDGGVTTTVTVNNPPATGPNTGNNSAVEVIITKKQPIFFANFIPGFVSPTLVSVRAVAALTYSAIDCVVALGPQGFITDNGGKGIGGGIQAPNCGVVTNGNLTVNGQPNVNARSIGYVGALKGPSSGYPEGQPMRSIAVSDPCLTIVACEYLANLTTSQVQTPCLDSPGVTPGSPLTAGRYCYGSTWTCPATPLVLSPALGALFVFDQGIPCDASGTGVTIYNSIGGLDPAGAANLNFSAPTTGPTVGIAFYQPPSNTNQIGKSGASGSYNFSGMFYAPSANMILNGALPNISFLVAYSILMNGAVLDAAGLSTGTTGHPFLAE